MVQTLTDNVMMRDPEVQVNRVQNTEEREPPRDAFNNGVVAILGELVDDRSEQQKVDNRPRGCHTTT